MVYCCKRCRQAAWEFRRGAVARERAAQPLCLAYADPPYPGLARRYYADHPDYAGEVDHRALLERLATYDGWALSTSARSLPMVLGLAAELGLEVAVAAWVRGPRRVPSARPLSAWEPVVYTGGRQVLDASPPGRVDALVHGARARTTDPAHVVGAKPSTFAYWMFELLGARPGDEFDDLFPGSGGIGRAWQAFVGAGADASPPGSPDASPRGLPDASARAAHDASQPSDRDLPDASPRGLPDASARAAHDASTEYSLDASPTADPDASGRSCPTGAP
jgi:hypothetical protein